MPFTPFANNVLILALSTESFCSYRDHYVDLPQAGNAEPRGVHDAGLGLTQNFCRVTLARSCPRVPASGRAADADPSGSDILFCPDPAPAPPDPRTYATDLSRALTLCSAQRVKLLVAAAPQGPRPHSLSPNRQGDGAVVETVRRRGQVRDVAWVVARVLIRFVSL